MMNLVEKELNWVLCSPDFYSAGAILESERQMPESFAVSLPEPIPRPSTYAHLCVQESSSLLANPFHLSTCLDELHAALPNLASGRLGLRFELYLLAALRARYGARNVKTRVAVRQNLQKGGVKTWGEFDFLVLDEALGRVEHWESSVKFYLQIQDHSAWKWCWGPAVSDRLDLKGPKTFLQQIVLSSTALGVASMPAEWRNMPIVKRVFAKGTIFYHWNPESESLDERLSRIVMPSALDSQHLKSWWIFPEQLGELRRRYPETTVSLIPRKSWLTGLDVENCENGEFEPWEIFQHHLSGRLAWASERRECIHAGLYTSTGERRLLTAGFIAAPHFVEARRSAVTGDDSFFSMVP